MKIGDGLPEFLVTSEYYFSQDLLNGAMGVGGQSPWPLRRQVKSGANQLSLVAHSANFSFSVADT